MKMANYVHLSKRLSWLLRHGAMQEGVHIGSDGFIEVDAILQHPQFACDFNLEIIKSIVTNDKKQRYTLRQNADGLYQIRANQGHSIDKVQNADCLERIHSADNVKLAVHGTYYKYWSRIKMEGLRPMGRLHVHFAMYDDKLLTSNQHCTPISGFRSGCEILIYLDVQKAIACGGMEIFRSTNNVILCAGIDGCISKEFFLKVVDRRTGRELEF